MAGGNYACELLYITYRRKNARVIIYDSFTSGKIRQLEGLKILEYIF